MPPADDTSSHPLQQQQQQQPKRSPSRVRFNFTDGFTPLPSGSVAGGNSHPHVSFADGSGSGSGSSLTALRALSGASAMAAGEGLISDPGTPTHNLAEAAAHIRRTLSLGSLSNLLDLATEAARQTAVRSRTTSLDPGLVLGASPAMASGRSSASLGSPNASASALYLPSLSSSSLQHEHSAMALSNPADDAAERERLLREDAQRAAAFEAKRELARQTLRDVREAILRPSDEPPRRPADWERVFVLTMLKSTRSFISAYGLRAGVNFVLCLFKTLRTRRLSLRALFASLASATSLRFALLLSTFTFLHTLVGQALRLAPPAAYVRRRLAHSLTLLRRSYSQSTSLLEAVEEGLDVLALDCSFGPPLVEFDSHLGERRWHAAAAGAVAGGFAIYWVRPGGERRAVIEQVLVRGLEGAWRGTMRSLGWSIPGGEVVLFGLCAGQIMYSWIMAPERMPKSFNSFITATFNGPPQAPAILRSLLRTRTIDPALARKVLDYPGGVTAGNRVRIAEILRTLERTRGTWPGPAIIPDALLQPTHDRPLPNLLARFALVFKGALPVYATLHFLPAFLLKRGQLVRRKAHATDPPSSAAAAATEAEEMKEHAPTLGLEMEPRLPGQGRKGWKIHWAQVARLLKRSAIGTARSSAFLAMFVFIYHGAISVQHPLYRRVPSLLRRLLVSRSYTWFAGFLTCLALFLEAPSRRPELALYVLPRSITAAYMGLRHRTRMPRSVRFEEGVLTAWAMAMLCDRMRWGEEKDLSRLARKVLYQFT